MLQFFKTQYIFNEIFRKHPYPASIYSKDFSMQFQIGEFSEDHQKYNRNTHTHTHTYTKQKKLPGAEVIKKVHMLHKYG